MLEGAVAIVLAVGDGPAAFQAAAVTIGLPFAVVLLIMCLCYSLYNGLPAERG